jgi:3',5'-nucleoside bisphosphate phosphatase
MPRPLRSAAVPDAADQRPTFDLQSHSIYSDGALPPTEVVARAAAAGVELLALSDHDTVEGVEEALAAAQREGIRLVPATELSSIDGDREDLHVLGYGIDHTDAQLLATLEDWRADRLSRGWRMADALQELGWELQRDRLMARSAQGKPVGRPHIAQAAFDHPANAARIAEENLHTFSDLLVAYLIPGAPAFRRRTKPTVAQAIEAIHQAGGVAVWAHPFWDIDQGPEVIASLDRFKNDGLDGVEAFYITFTEEQTHLLTDAAEERDLLTTGSADFHGPEHPHFSAFRAFSLYGRTARLGRIAD